MADLKKAMAHVSWKSHENGFLNPKAHLRKKLSIEQILNAPRLPIHWVYLTVVVYRTGPHARLLPARKSPKILSVKILLRLSPCNYPPPMVLKWVTSLGTAQGRSQHAKPQNALMPRPVSVIRVRISV